MFSRNGKISEKQMRRMLVLPVFASSIFVIPYLGARLFETSIVPGLLIFFAFACFYITCIYGMGQWYQKKGCTGQKDREKEGESCRFTAIVEHDGMGGRLLLVVQILRLIVRLAFYVVLSIAVLGEGQVPFMQGKKTDSIANLLVVLPLLLVALYGANVVKVDKWKAHGKEQNQNRMDVNYLGVEKQGRIHEIMFWVLFIPFIIVILFGLKEVDYAVFVPHFDMSCGRLVFCGYALLTFILPVENYLYLRPDLKMRKILEDEEKEGGLHSKKQRIWISYAAVLITLVLMLVITLLILGIYGVYGAGKEEMVTISIMRYIRLPFGILERFDVLMVWFFMTGCFLLICGTLYYAGHLLSVLFKKVNRCCLLLVVLGVVLVIVAFLPSYPVTLWTFLWYGAMLDIPLSLIVPLLGMALVKLEEGEEQDEEKAD